MELNDDWLFGWDPTPGIVSVWADARGRAQIWRRSLTDGRLIHETATFRPWVLLDRLDDVRPAADRVTWLELEGPGELRYLVSADDGIVLADAVTTGASRRLGRRIDRVRDLGKESVLVLPPEEQYLVATGRTYFRDLSFDSLRRLQFDLETTGLNAERDRIFMIAVRDPEGRVEILETSLAAGGTRADALERGLIARLMACVAAADPDVIENHNLHGFDLPFLERRARAVGITLTLGRVPAVGLRQRAARRGFRAGEDDRRARFVVPGRELIDTLDAVLRHDFSTRELPGHGLKAVASHLGVSTPDREVIPGDRIHRVYQRDPARVRRYAASDVNEVAAVARLLGGAAFALARIAPRQYERLADAGAATGVIDPLLVRAYLRRGEALPAHAPGRDTPHSGAALHLFATGVAHRVVKADVASLYPSLMRSFRIGPARDRLGALVALVDRLVELRLGAKADARAASPGSPERHTHEALSAAMKLVVNSAYGYLAAGGGLTRFADVDAANDVTRRGRETLDVICTALAGHGVTLLEADTDGVYFAVPEGWREADERRVVADVAALLPPLVHLEYDGRYAAMLSHEPKNYALLGYDRRLVLRGVAYRSSRAEPFGEAFLRRAISALLVGDVAGVRAAYLAVATALLRRDLPTYDVSSRVRLTKSPADYAATRGQRRELSYEAMLAGGRRVWTVGERVRVYRRQGGEAGLVIDADEGDSEAEPPPRDYDQEHYLQVLRTTFASRLARAFRPADFEELFADPRQPSLFTIEWERVPIVLEPGPGPAKGTAS